MGVLNSSKKNVTKTNRNYFYAGTFIIAIMLVVCYYVFHINFVLLREDNGFFNYLVSWLDHNNDWHLYVNLICLAICGVFFERKFGTFSFITMFVAFGLMTSLATIGFAGTDWTGMSGVVYAFFGFFFVTILFDMKKHFNLKELALSFVCLFLIIFMIVCSGDVLVTGKISGFFDFQKISIMKDYHFISLILGLLSALLFYMLSFTKQGASSASTVKKVRETKVSDGVVVDNQEIMQQAMMQQAAMQQAAAMQQMMIQQQQQAMLQQVAMQQMQQQQQTSSPQPAPMEGEKTPAPQPQAVSQQPSQGASQLTEQQIADAWKKKTAELQKASVHKDEGE